MMGDMVKSKYVYTGAVLDCFHNHIATLRNMETMAASEKQAKSNIAFKYKRSIGLAPHAKIILTGKICKI